MKDARAPRNKRAVVVLIDAHSAVIDRCENDILTRIRSVTAAVPHGSSDHMGDVPRQSYHPGTRGETATDAAQHAAASARRQFIDRVSPASAIIARVTSAIHANLAAKDLSAVHELLERTGAHTTGVVGPIASLDAAEHGAVDVIFMTQRFQDQHPAESKRVVDSALAHNGRVEIIADRAAELLDAQAGGVGALLRFALHKMPVGR